MPKPSDIISYYQSSQWLYRLLCYDSRSLGMHLGFWDKGTENRQQAMINENDAVVSFGQIRQGHHVLDAGCGIGGTAIHIAKNSGACVTGITLDPKQVSLATRYAADAGVAHLVEFIVMDYERMRFPDAFFDVVYGIESICHATTKELFFKEAYRVLKPGGRLVIMDGYAVRMPKNQIEKRVLGDVEWGFRLAPVVTGEQMKKVVQTCGFTHVQLIDKTRETWPSVRYFSRLAAFMMPIGKALSWLPSPHLRAIYPNAVAPRAIMRSYEMGIGMYAVHVGTKPGKRRGKRR